MYIPARAWYVNRYAHVPQVEQNGDEGVKNLSSTKNKKLLTTVCVYPSKTELPRPRMVNMG